MNKKQGTNNKISSSTLNQEEVVFSIGFLDSGSILPKLSKDMRKALQSKISKFEKDQSTFKKLEESNLLQRDTKKPDAIEKVKKQMPPHVLKKQIYHFHLSQQASAFGFKHGNGFYITHIDPTHRTYK